MAVWEYFVRDVSDEEKYTDNENHIDHCDTKNRSIDIRVELLILNQSIHSK